MDNTLILSLTAMILTFSGIAIKICFASKCTDVELCCIKIQHNVEIEPIRYDETPSTSSNKNNNDNVRDFNLNE